MISEIPDSDFYFDFEECNICLKSKYFDVIPWSFMPVTDSTVLIVSTSLTNTLRDIYTEGKVKSEKNNWSSVRFNLSL